MSPRVLSPVLTGPLLRFRSVESTQDVARELARRTGGGASGRLPRHLLTVCAGYQTRGRGRLGRRWLAERDQALLLSMAFLYGEPEEPSRLALFAALAACRTAEALAGRPAALKWPNDVVMEGRKLGGVLVETSPAEAGRLAVVGVGINVSRRPLPGAACLGEFGAGAGVEEVLERFLADYDRVLGCEAGRALAAVVERLSLPPEVTDADGRRLAVSGAGAGFFVARGAGCVRQVPFHRVLDW